MIKNLNLKAAISFVPAALLATPALAQTLPLRDGYYGHMWGDGYGMMGFFGMGFMLLFWGVVIFLGVTAYRWFSARDGKTPGGNSALAILNERFAKGEIDAEDFELRRKTLEI